MDDWNKVSDTSIINCVANQDKAKCDVMMISSVTIQTWQDSHLMMQVTRSLMSGRTYIMVH
jgi:hypothetical protein